jgi:DNA-binding MarR family transcriptional regulator
MDSSLETEHEEKVIANDLASKGFVENYLLFQLAIVSHRFSEEFHYYLKEMGISPSRWRILVNIYDKPGISINSLAKHTLYDQPRVTKAVNKLCREGVIMKKQSAEDKRRVMLHITNTGKETLIPIIQKAKHQEEEILNQLASNDRHNFKAVLKKLMRPYIKELSVLK